MECAAITSKETAEEFAKEEFEYWIQSEDRITWDGLQEIKDILGPERYEILKRTRLQSMEGTMDGTEGEPTAHDDKEEISDDGDEMDDNQSYLELKDDVEEAIGDIKSLAKQLEMVKKELTSLKSEQEKVTTDIEKLQQWRKNLLSAKSDDLGISKRNASENRLEKSRSVLFLCPLCPGLFWHKMIKLTVELHGNFWVYYDPSQTDLSWLDSSQYEFYPAVLDENRAITRKSWRDTNEFKTIRAHLRFCYRSRHGSELDDDKTGRFDMWRPVQKIKKEHRFKLNGKGMRCYTSDEVKTIIDNTAKEQMERERSRFLVQLKDTFDPNLMARVAGEGYQPRKSIGQIIRENSKRKREKMQEKMKSSIL